MLIDVIDHPVDAGDQVRREHRAIAAGHLDRHDARIGGDAAESGVAVVAGDDAGEVGAVSEGVDARRRGIGCLGGEVDGDDDLVLQRGHRCDAGVDDGDVDALAGEARGPSGRDVELGRDGGERAALIDRVGDGRHRGGAIVEIGDGHRSARDEREHAEDQRAAATRCPVRGRRRLGGEAVEHRRANG